METVNLRDSTGIQTHLKTN